MAKKGLSIAERWKQPPSPQEFLAYVRTLTADNDVRDDRPARDRSEPGDTEGERKKRAR